METYNNFVDWYKSSLSDAMDKINHLELWSIASIIENTTNSNGKVYLIGNGGSAAIAAHFCHNLCWDVSADRPIGKKVKAIMLNEQMSHLTGLANDRHYDDIFKIQLENLLNKNDMVIGISASGNSANIIEAIKYTKETNVQYVTITGQGGGELKKLGGDNINVISNDQQVTEDIQSSICHIVVRMLYYK